ncbi:MAG TPA: DoxX family protein [Candidatus Dormibacteraeota bacterium]|nr:DoxX family protein [Candidatus Dormibacteraeota bacterium]
MDACTEGILTATALMGFLYICGVDLGLLLIRVVVGLLLVGHGTQKLFGWFGGSGIEKWAAGITSRGFVLPVLWAWAGALGETVGGVLLFVGFLSPLGSLGIAGSMLVAMVTVHWSKGIWNSKGGIEFPLTNMVAALALALTGPGVYSLDHLFGISLPTWFGWLAAVVVLGGATIGLLTRTPSAAPSPQPATTAR